MPNLVLMPNPNLFRRIYDVQQRIALRAYLKVPQITLFAVDHTTFCCDTGYRLHKPVSHWPETVTP